MNREKVLKLAKLARIKLSDTEAESLSHEFEAILNYVGEVKNISKADSLKLKADSFPIRNVMREDGEPHKSGLYTGKILKEAPGTQGGYIKVKKIL